MNAVPTGPTLTKNDRGRTTTIPTTVLVGTVDSVKRYETSTLGVRSLVVDVVIRVDQGVCADYFGVVLTVSFWADAQRVLLEGISLETGQRLRILLYGGWVPHQVEMVESKQVFYIGRSPTGSGFTILTEEEQDALYPNGAMNERVEVGRYCQFESLAALNEYVERLNQAIRGEINAPVPLPKPTQQLQ